MRKFLMSVISAVLVLAATTVSAQDKVMIGEPNWPGAKIIANLLKVIITEKLGVKADLVPGTNAVIFAAMGGGKGDIDVHPDVWWPNQQNFTDKYVDQDKTVALSKGSYKGKTGFCVPTNVATQSEITSIYDLATPQAQKVFDSDGDGKGEIWVGAPGWASTNVHLVKVRDYGIGDFLEPTKEDDTLFFAKLADAVKKKQGVVFYCYAPHYVHKLYDLTMLQEPPHDPSKYKIVQPTDDADWFAKSEITTGDKEKTVRIGYSRSLETRAPEAAAFLSRIDLDAATVSGWTHAVVVEKREAADVVGEWVANSAGIVDGWLGL